MKKILLAIALSSWIASPVLASDIGGYVTGMFGMNSEQNLNTAMSYGVLAGYKFQPAISAEVGYVTLANNANLIIAQQGAVGSTSASISGYEIAGVYDYPLANQISIFGRAGYAKMNIIVNGNGGSTSAAESGLLLGAGVKYMLSNSYSVQAGLNSYYLSNNSGSDNPINLYLSGTYNF